ncbi:MAG: ADP-glyceromanno-heptose 6-epimerase [Candidatus Goldiibacteriota bacterium]
MIAVTGGAGFIGSALIWGLNKRNCRSIMAVDELGETEKWKNLVNLKFEDYEEKDAFLKRVIFDDKSLRSGIDGIIHMGACSATTEKNASYLIENNYKYTQVLAKWCVKHGKRFVYASSAATYGGGSAGFDDDESLLDELKPLNMYGYSKHIMDLWAYRKGLLGKAAGIKFFNVFGPNEYHKDDMRSVVHKAFEQINETGRLKLFKSYDEKYEDGGQLRDFVCVKDAVEMTLFIYDRGLAGIYNAGAGKARSFADLGKAVFKAMGRKENIEYIDMPESIKDKYQYFTEAKMDKLKTAGYDKTPASLEETVKDYIQNYLMAEDAYLGN